MRVVKFSLAPMLRSNQLDCLRLFSNLASLPWNSSHNVGATRIFNFLSRIRWFISSHERMNELNEQAFWLELFAVRIRHEERRSAALQANLELLENGHGSRTFESIASPNHVTSSKAPTELS
jgi:hypothetical protein